MRSRRLIAASLLTVAVAAAGFSGPQRAGAAPSVQASDGTNAVAAPQLRQNGAITSYVDPQGVTHLLADVYNTGATVESGAAILDLYDTDGKTVLEQDQAYVPTGWLEKGEYAPIDYLIDAGVLVGGKAFSGKWKIDRFVGYPNQVAPSHNFTLSDITGPTSASDPAVLHGMARNDASYSVVLIKVIASFFDSSGNIVYAEPTDVNSNVRPIAPGAVYSFVLPKQTGVPTFDPMNNKIIVEANEPGAPLPLKNSPSVVGPLGSKANFPKIPAYRLNLSEHYPVLNTVTAGVPNPTASDLAGAANPPTVVRQHDSAAADTGSDGPQALVNQTAPAPRTTAAYVPILLILLLGGYGLIATIGNARLGLARFRDKRRAKRDALAALAPGAVGGYGAMRGSGR